MLQRTHLRYSDERSMPQTAQDKNKPGFSANVHTLQHQNADAPCACL